MSEHDDDSAGERERTRRIEIRMIDLGMSDQWLALRDFKAFVEQYDTSDAKPGQMVLLQDYMAAWLEYGDAVTATFGMYSVYLLTLVTIIGEYEHDPSILNYDHNGTVIERRVERLVDLTDSDAHCWLRSTYERRKMELLMGRQPH